MKFVLKLKHCRYDVYLKTVIHGEAILSTEWTVLDANDVNLYLAMFPKQFKVIKVSYPIS
ncbi:MAG: hypothetical protein K2L36_08310 [Eubacterium sp.]|nr:hypothetical protein [Eubacterium sp.]